MDIPRYNRMKPAICKSNFSIRSMSFTGNFKRDIDWNNGDTTF